MSGQENKPVTTSSIEVEEISVDDYIDALPAFWMTRDKIGGVLMEVDVWAIEPSRVEHPDGDVIWLEPELADIMRDRIAMGDEPAPCDGVPLMVDESDACIDSWSIRDAKRRYSGAPDTARECVRVGEAPENQSPRLLS